MTDSGKTCSQPPGEFFAWPKGWRLTALDEATLLIPGAILSDNDVIGSVINADDDVMLNLPTGQNPESDAHILIRLKKGQSVYLSKSCQAMVLPNHEGDKASKRFQAARVEA